MILMDYIAVALCMDPRPPSLLLISLKLSKLRGWWHWWGLASPLLLLLARQEVKYSIFANNRFHTNSVNFYKTGKTLLPSILMNLNNVASMAASVGLG